MILSEKITALRKKNGWSQEEFAQRLDVSRQSVSKWESAASIPDINKIIEMSRLFGISTDYLLKDELETESFSEGDDANVVRVSLESANDFIEKTKAFGRKIALGVLMCILSPILLIILGGMSDSYSSIVSENAAAGIGITVMLALVACAVTVFIVSGVDVKKYEYLKKGNFEAEYGVPGIINEKRNAFEPTMRKTVAAGVALCIISPLPLIIAGAMEASDIVCVFMTALLLMLVAVAVYGFVRVLCEKDAYDCLLRTDDYDLKRRKENRKSSKFGSFYWPTLTAVYLAVSFLTSRWDITWLIWPVGALLFAGLSAIIGGDEENW